MKKILLAITFFILSPLVVYGEFGLSVSPIKYEITLDPGQSALYQATITNLTNLPSQIITGKSDFFSKDTTGTPYFVRKDESVYSDQELSSWINIEEDSFTLNPRDQKTVRFNISVPANATPGGKYAAVFFNQKWDTNSDGESGSVGVNVDYGILILLTVRWPIISSGSVGPIVIEQRLGGGTRWTPLSPFLMKKDICLGLDLTASNHDGKCVDAPSLDLLVAPEEDMSLTVPEDTTTQSGTSFVFKIPLTNSGTIHLKPVGSIEIIDENGQVIPSIGREVIRDPNGVVQGERIVDYLPINESAGNVLPWTERIFEVPWEGIPYRDVDAITGESVVLYKSFDDFFGLQSVFDKRPLFFWERRGSEIGTRDLTARITLTYPGPDGAPVEYSTSRAITINYLTQKPEANPYFFGAITLIILIIWALHMRVKGHIVKRRERRSMGEKIPSGSGAKKIARKAPAPIGEAAKKRTKKATAIGANIDIVSLFDTLTRQWIALGEVTPAYIQRWIKQNISSDMSILKDQIAKIMTPSEDPLSWEKSLATMTPHYKCHPRRTRSDKDMRKVLEMIAQSLEK